ncbi:MAG TPA: dockerin type I domain-containing protein [Terriglobia bacterium]|nr:dockerin type I domain-containing protein [Terriglobia bacterium]
MDNDRHQESDAPPGLTHAFRKLQARDIPVPRSLDDAVLKAARRALNQPVLVESASRWWAIQNWPNWARVPGLAAAGLLVAFLSFMLMPSRFAREDVNRDRNVNILDAFELARELRSGATLPARFDFNGDGIVNRADADVVAAEAVRLERSGRL